MQNESTFQDHQEVFELACSAADRYVSELDSRPVIPTTEAIANLQTLHEPLSIEPTEPKVVIETLEKIGAPATVASTGGRYFGFVVGGAMPVCVAANWLASTWDQNAGTWVCLLYTSPSPRDKRQSRMPSSA